MPCCVVQDELSGADIKAVCTEAGLLALRERRMRVTQVGAEQEASQSVSHLLDPSNSTRLEMFMGVNIWLWTCGSIPLSSSVGKCFDTRACCMSSCDPCACRLTSARQRRKCSTRRKRACRRACICRLVCLNYFPCW